MTTRRSFLILGGTAMLVAALPTLALASAPLPDYAALGINVGKLEVIEQALDTAHIYSFKASEQPELFGLNPNSARTHAELRDLVQSFVLEYHNIDAWNRCRFIAAIGSELRRKFPDDLDAQVQHLNKTLEDRSARGLSGRLLLRTHYQEDLRRAAELLAGPIGYHNFDELDSFV